MYNIAKINETKKKFTLFLKKLITQNTLNNNKYLFNFILGLT